MTDVPHHRDLAAGRWQTLSLAEQLGNVGSEVGRVARWQDQDQRRSGNAFERAVELLDLTISDPRWRGRLRELTRLRECLGDAYGGGRDYGTTFTDLERYLNHFARLARRDR